MKNMKLVIAFVLVAVVGAGAAGGAFWWFNMKQAPAANAKAEPKHADAEEHKYITLDKLVVMLQRSPGETTVHYLAADLVFSTSEKKEKQAKEHLPMLRSVAVKALSAYPMSKAEAMTVDQFASALNRAFAEHYAKEGKVQPFSEVMIGKLIIE